LSVTYDRSVVFSGYSNCHDITEILLKVVLNTITRNPFNYCLYHWCLIYILYIYKFKIVCFFFSPSVLHISQIKKIIIYFLDQSNEESSTFLYNIYIIKEHNKIKLNWSLKTKGNNLTIMHLSLFDYISCLFLSCQCLFTLRKYRVLSLVSN
jgi:hypothetical protein